MKQVQRPTSSSHLAKGGDLLLPNTPERTKRTQMRSMRAKRIDNAFAAGVPALNWVRKVN